MKIKKLLIAISATISIAVAITAVIATATATGLPGYIADFAGVLSASERDMLEDKASRILDDYDCEARVIIVESIGGQSLDSASNSYYHDNNLGYGPDRSCVILLISLEGRDMELAYWGFADYALYTYGAEKLANNYIAPQLSGNRYYAAFDIYLDMVDEYFSLAKAGAPLSARNDPEVRGRTLGVKLTVSALIALLVALAVCFTWKSQMKTARIARKADQFIPAGGFSLTGQQDMFLYRTVSRRKIERSSSTVSGGARSIRSGGGGHTSRKF